MTSVGRGCGKLYLTGEYAVMSVDGAAVIAGVDRYVTATATLADAGRGTVHSAYYGEAGRSLVVGESGAELLGETDIVANAISLVYAVAGARGAQRRPGGEPGHRF
nr:hypothetical protein [Corynebacterium lactis]